MRIRTTVGVVLTAVLTIGPLDWIPSGRFERVDRQETSGRVGQTIAAVGLNQISLASSNATTSGAQRFGGAKVKTGRPPRNPKGPPSTTLPPITTIPPGTTLPPITTIPPSTTLPPITTIPPSTTTVPVTPPGGGEPPTTPPATTAPAPPITTPAPAPGSPAGGSRVTGFAEYAGLSGGISGTSHQVTSLADSGPGTYRDALSEGDRYVTFAPELAGGTIDLQSPVRVESSNLTIDGSSAKVTISGFATKFSGTNIVVAGVTFANMTGSSNEDALTFRSPSTTQIFGLYGNTFRTATDGLVDIIWNNGHDVYATICGNRFERHDKAMLVHSGADDREGGTYYVTLCRNLWSDIYQRAPFSRDARVHQYNDVFVDYGKPDGAGGGAKSGGSLFRSQHFVENAVAIPRGLGTSTWTGDAVTRPRTEFAGPHSGDQGDIRITGSMLGSVSRVTAQQTEFNPQAVFTPPYAYPVLAADEGLRADVVRGAGTCQPIIGPPIVNPCGGLLGTG